MTGHPPGDRVEVSAETLSALENKAREAEEASHAKSRFLAAMSHEIRTPMNAIMGFAQLLELSGLDEKQSGYVKAIRAAGGSLMNLLTDLLDLSQVEAGEMRIELRTFELTRMIDELVDWWGSSATERGLAFKVDVADDLPGQVISDPVRIQQVLNNYLGNAVKFTSRGEIALSVHVLSRTERNAMVRFSVKDTGDGLAEADLDQIFAPFVQLERDDEIPQSGWGLGLSICKSIAAALSGNVGVASAPGDGATFWFDVPVTLPAVERVSEPSEATRHDIPADTVPLRVLLAEDDLMSQQVMEEILGGLGHEVTTVSDGFSVIDRLAHEPFDVLLLDAMMPGLDGVETAKRVRASKENWRTVPVIFCSAHLGPDAEASYRSAGATDILSKPVDRHDLAHALAAVGKHLASK